MRKHQTSDPVSLIIKACHQSEEEAKRIYHALAEKRERKIELKSGRTFRLAEKQLGEFVERFSAEVEPAYWESKRLKK